MNKVELIGRLTHDVEMRQTPNGVSLARFSIAVTRRFKNSNGEYDADFINCVAWRQTGEFIAKHFQKGGMIAVVGSIQSRSWDGTMVKSNMQQKLWLMKYISPELKNKITIINSKHHRRIIQIIILILISLNWIILMNRFNVTIKKCEEVI